MLLDDVKWKWGEIPETTAHVQSVRCVTSKLSQTPVSATATQTSPVLDTPETDTRVATLSQEYKSEVTSQPLPDAAVEHTSEEGVPNIMDLLDSESEKGFTESKLLTETNNVYTPSSNELYSGQWQGRTITSQVLEPLPKTKKGSFAVFVFTRIIFS